ncbi:hypothetical protein [Elizabethkingia meningoseptica]|uniref:hypothetical protein n=1 Tax=Elizabethkingia meningoseptica TaxID=238 RepID=UPI0038926F18
MAEPKAKTLQMKLGFFDEDLKKPMHDDILKWINENAENFVYDLFPSLKSWDENRVKFLKNYCYNLVSKKTKELETQIEKNIIKIEEYKKEENTLNANYFSDLIEEKVKRNEFLQNKIAFYKNSIDLQELPKREPIIILEKEWEFPVTSQSKSSTGYVSSKNLIGFIDLRLKFRYTSLSISGVNFQEKDIIDKIQWKQSSEGVDFKNGYENFFLCEENLYIEVKTEIKSLGELFRQLQTYRTYINGKFIVVCPDDKEKKIIEEQGFKFLKYK